MPLNWSATKSLLSPACLPGSAAGLVALDEGTMAAAATAREARRPVNVYEEAIAEWLDQQPNPNKTTWNERRG